MTEVTSQQVMSWLLLFWLVSIQIALWNSGKVIMAGVLKQGTEMPPYLGTPQGPARFQGDDSTLN